MNSISLSKAWMDGGWLVFAARSDYLDVGDNLIGLMAKWRESGERETVLEKPELRVEYRN